jgi:predicted dienelactone hydrolase
VSRVIDALLADAALGPHIQRERIGVAGHSNGAYTALAVGGAKPSPAASVAHCRDHPDDSRFCSYGGAATREATRTLGDIPDVHDPRVRAIALMAPNAAPFTDDALAQVAVPVRVYGAERDDLTPVRYHAERLAKALPPRTEYVLVKRAGHFSFVASFPRVLRLVAGEAAQDPEGFDRDAMHEVVNSEIVGFFDRKLPSDRTRWTMIAPRERSRSAGLPGVTSAPAAIFARETARGPGAGMRRALLVLFALCALAGCASAGGFAPLLTDAERCARFGGVWSFDTCRAGN